jgi:transcriptional regulator with XRE-family HTH domain
MRAKQSAKFAGFYSDLEAEARAEGPEAVADLRAKEIKYALINSLIMGRQDLNITQAGLAERSGVAQTEISRIERGRKSPTLETFSRLAGALGIEFGPRLVRRRGTRGVGGGRRRIALAPRRAVTRTGPASKRAPAAVANKAASKKK